MWAARRVQRGWPLHLCQRTHRLPLSARWPRSSTRHERALEGLPTVRRQLTDAGVLPLIILMALRRPCAEAAEAHGAAEAAVEAAEEVVAAKEEETVAAADDGGVLLTRSPGGGNAPYHCLTTAAAFRALLEITSDDDAAKRATFDLLGPAGLLGMLGAISAATSADLTEARGAARQRAGGTPVGGGGFATASSSSSRVAQAAGARGGGGIGGRGRGGGGAGRSSDFGSSMIPAPILRSLAR